MIRELNEHEIRALHYELLLKDILAMAERLPPFSDVVWKVMPLIRKMAPIKEIEAVIKYDQAIAARVLALSQSSFYGRRSKVSSLQDAIRVLGEHKLVQVIMTACAARYFQGKKPKQDPDERQLWEHSVAAALMGEMVARHLRHPKVLTVYTAALLHDIGKTVLSLYAKIYLGTSLSKMRLEGMELIESERRALGIDHQELGEIIARRWHFPTDVIVAIGHHHCPQKARSDQFTAAIVYAANKMVTSMHLGDESDEPLEPSEDLVFKRLGLTPGIVENLKETLSEGIAEVIHFLTIY
jgi:putative nucleotidyltransferase with HDIG domain